MAKTLTDKQQAFIDALFGAADGDPKVAAEIAGYATADIGYIMRPIQAEIGEALRVSLGTKAALAAYKNLMRVLDGTDDPLGRKERLAASKDLLDRAGFKAPEKIEISTQDTLFILPPKD